MIFNLATLTKQIVAHASMTEDPQVTSLLLAQSDMMRPRGRYATPDADYYQEVLRSLIVPNAGPGLEVVRHDPITGMPAAVYNLVPALIIMSRATL